MNGVRSTFMRRGYLLTALSALLLLAASVGTASAQSIGFVGTSGTVGEGASDAPGAPVSPLLVKVRIAGLTTSNRTTALGDVTLEHNADDLNGDGSPDLLDTNRRVWQITGTALNPQKRGINSGDSLEGLNENGELTLAIIDPSGDRDWKSGNFTMTLKSTGSQITPSPAKFTVTVTDSDVPPVASFNKSSISLTEDSSTPVTVSVATPRGTLPGAIPTALTDGERITTTTRAGAADSVLLVMVDPPGALDDDGEATAPTTANPRADTGPIEITDGDMYLQPHAPGGRRVPGMYVVGKVKNETDMTALSQAWTIRATKDMAGFRSPNITIAFATASLTTDVGDIQAGPALNIMVQSDEPVPTVSFATSSLSIDEGSMETVAILADSTTGPEVGSVTVEMNGDAMISLHQDGKMLEANADGTYDVDLMGNANTILTISSHEDRALEDGMTSSATLTIVDASGANIGDRDSVMVTIVGATAVPALPLIGQLLLALFLMAGGSRLYRRRQS